MLLCFSGTIPVVFKSVTYNIPICIWIPQQYPYVPPYVYVTPTANMVIRPNNHVDQVGKVYHGYLHTWSTRRDSCNLVDLVGVLQQIFATEPPVYSKPPASTNQAVSFGSQGHYQQSTSVYGGRNYTPTTLSSPPSYAMMPVPSLPDSRNSSRNNQITSPQEQFRKEPVMTDEQIQLASLRSALTDKLKSNVAAVNSEFTSEIERELENNRLLLENENLIVAYTKRLMEEKSSLQDLLKAADRSIEEASVSLESLRTAKLPNIDDLYVVPNSLHKQ